MKKPSDSIHRISLFWLLLVSFVFVVSFNMFFHLLRFLLSSRARGLNTFRASTPDQTRQGQRPSTLASTVFWKALVYQWLGTSLRDSYHLVVFLLGDVNIYISVLRLIKQNTTGWLKHQKLIFSQFWRVEVHD